MTLRNLEIFLKVCETGNMTKAAQQLYISQSAVSHAITQLEQHYDTRLFVRQANRVYTTSEGLHLQKFCRRVLHSAQALETEMKRLKTRHRLRVGVVNTFGQQMILEILSDYSKEREDIEFEMQTFPESVMMEMLDTGAIDAAFTFNATETHDKAVMVIRRRDKAFCCSSKSRYLSVECGSAVEISQLPKRKLPFFFEEDSIHLIPDVVQALYRHGIEVDVRGVLQTPDEVKHAAVLDFGIGMVSKAGAYRTPKLNFFELKGLELAVDLQLVYRKNQADVYPVGDFVQYVKGTVGSRRMPRFVTAPMVDMHEVASGAVQERPSHAFYKY